jgi:membrane protein DedA with SNARE-associated domain
MPFLYQIFSLVPIFKYPLLSVAAIFEGPLVMMISGAFIRLNLLDFISAYIALMLGDLIGDIVWYCLGYFGGQRFIARFGKYFSITDKLVAVIERFFRRYHEKILIISKLTTGFGFAPVVLLTAGITKVPFRRYLLINLVGELFWTGFLLGIGFFFTDLYVKVSDMLGRLAISAVIIIAILLLFGLFKYARSRIMSEESTK